MSKSPRTVKRSAGTPSVSRSTLTAAARNVVARSAATGRVATTKSASKGASPRTMVVERIGTKNGAATPTRSANSRAKNTAVAAAIHTPSVIRPPDVEALTGRAGGARSR